MLPSIGGSGGRGLTVVVVEVKVEVWLDWFVKGLVVMLLLVLVVLVRVVVVLLVLVVVLVELVKLLVVVLVLLVMVSVTVTLPQLLVTLVTLVSVSAVGVLLDVVVWVDVAGNVTIALARSPGSATSCHDIPGCSGDEREPRRPGGSSLK